MEHTDYYPLIRQWAYDRNIIVGSTKQAQFTKLIEEIAEIEVDPLDGIGDSLVVLTIIAAQCGIDLENVAPKHSDKSLLADLGDLAACLSKGKPVYEAVAHLHGSFKSLASSLDLELYACMDMAWNEIKDRKGKMVGGVFVKEADLD